MLERQRIGVVIPALNEEAAIGRVLADVPPWVDDVVVADNGSVDGTASVVAAAGARVVAEPRRGYGQACLTGLAALSKCDIIVFLDADYSDDPREMGKLVQPILSEHVDLVIGSRVLGRCEPGALTSPQRFGNWLACRLIRWFWGVAFTDLGPFRAIRAPVLASLGMADRTYGWTVEMQVKAARRRLAAREVPVQYRRRIGQSKISGTVRGVVGAGAKILATILQAAMDDHVARRRSRPKEALIVLTRYPRPGRVKTRMIPVLGPDGAAALRDRLTARSLDAARRVRERRNLHLEVCYTGGEEPELRRWLGDDVAFACQGDGDLGARLEGSSANAFAAGRRAVVLIGTDCPELSADALDRAFEALRATDLVIGPAEDGGYYLLGLRRHVPELFRGIAWGHDEVFEQTVDAAIRMRLSITTLEALRDVDRPTDLPLVRLTSTETG
jgi:rSAM/selenodomain-associated transferase 1